MDRRTADRSGPTRILVVGGGFAGVWAALGAVRRLDEEGAGPTDVHVSLISTDPYLTIRPRLYEPHVADLRVPLGKFLVPVGVGRVQARVTAVDPAGQVLTATAPGDREVRLPFDRLVLAAGSHVVRPALRGLADNALTVDTYVDAQRLETHLRSLPERPAGPSRYSAVVIGAGFTGLEVATELIGRLAVVAGGSQGVSVTLVESSSEVGPDLGPGPRPAVLHALDQLGIGLRLGYAAAEVSADGVTLASGERLPASTTVWTGGLRASPLSGQLGVGTDSLGRVPVDRDLRVPVPGGVFAAGDVAHAMADLERPALMSCQHAIPMGKFAGHNAAADLVGGSLLPYEQTDYVTCLDLGAAGAIFTRGWDRHVLYTGATAKQLKEQINRRDIVPPLSGQRDDLLAAARPTAPVLDGLVELGQQIAPATLDAEPEPSCLGVV